MSDVPEDIRKLAEQVWRDIRMCDRGEPEGWIALAINHERERCARIAENEPRVWDADASDPQHRIAEKIRNP